MRPNSEYGCNLPNTYVPYAYDARADQSELKVSVSGGKDKLKRGYDVIKVDDPGPPPTVIYGAAPPPKPWVHPSRRAKL